MKTILTSPCVWQSARKRAVEGIRPPQPPVSEAMGCSCRCSPDGGFRRSLIEKTEPWGCVLWPTHGRHTPFSCTLMVCKGKLPLPQKSNTSHQNILLIPTLRNYIQHLFPIRAYGPLKGWDARGGNTSGICSLDSFTHNT